MGYQHTGPLQGWRIDCVQMLPARRERGCQGTVHCASFGFCEKCQPQMAAAAKHVLNALVELDKDKDPDFYGAVMALMIRWTEKKTER